MSRNAMSYAILIVASSAIAVSANSRRARSTGWPRGAPASPPMVLSTPAFPDGGVVPNRHTQVQQAERGISPALNWTNAPAATQSFVVHMRDPGGAQPYDRRSGSLARVEHSRCGEGITRRNARGRAASKRHRTNQRERRGVSWPRCTGSRTDAPLHLRGVCPRREARRTPAPMPGKPPESLKAMDGHVIGKAVMVGMFEAAPVKHEDPRRTGRSTKDNPRRKIHRRRSIFVDLISF